MSVNNHRRAPKYRLSVNKIPFWKDPFTPPMGAYFHPDKPIQLCLSCGASFDDRQRTCPKCRANKSIPKPGEGAGCECITITSGDNPRLDPILVTETRNNGKLLDLVFVFPTKGEIDDLITLGKPGEIYKALTRRNYASPEVKFGPKVQPRNNAYVMGQAMFERKGRVVKTVKGSRKFKPNLNTTKRFAPK